MYNAPMQMTYGVKGEVFMDTNLQTQTFIDVEKGVIVIKTINLPDFIASQVDLIMKRHSDIFKGLFAVGRIDFNNHIENISTFFKKHNLQETIVAKSKCNYEAGDIWNEKYGLKLAHERLELKVNTLHKKFSEILFDLFKNLSKDFGKQHDKYVNKIINKEEKILKILNK